MDDIKVEREYYDTGQLKSEKWYKNGVLHKEDGPAVIKYYTDGITFMEEWYKEGTMHREDGPAIIHYNNNGEIEKYSYYIEYKQLTEKEFIKYKTINDLLSDRKESKKPYYRR